MKTTLQKHSRIDALTLDPAHYTETLLSAAREVGLYDDAVVMAIQAGLFDLLSERLVKMTNGESCSVPAETAQAVLASLLYTIDRFLLTAPTPDDAAMRLAESSASCLYDEGLVRIKRRLAASELQYRKYLPLFRALPDSVMKTTAIDGIAGFFRAYHPAGFADANPITADYPLYLDANAITAEKGVDFLGRYLQGLIAEAKFLSKFRAETLHTVLSSADPLYRDNPSNLFAPMLATVTAMAILHRPFSAWKYGLTGDDITALQGLYDRGEMTNTSMTAAAEVVIDYLMLDGTEADYVRRAVGKLTDSAFACLGRHLPMLVFPCTDAAYRAVHRGSGSALYDDLAFRQALDLSGTVSYHGGRMTGEAFRCLDFDLRACASAEEKTDLILSRVQGLEDICDLLASDTGVLDKDEKAHLMASLPTEAREYLYGMIPLDDFVS